MVLRCRYAEFGVRCIYLSLLFPPRLVKARPPKNWLAWLLATMYVVKYPYRGVYHKTRRPRDIASARGGFVFPDFKYFSLWGTFDLSVTVIPDPSKDLMLPFISFVIYLGTPSGQ